MFAGLWCRAIPSSAVAGLIGFRLQRRDGAIGSPAFVQGLVGGHQDESEIVIPKKVRESGMFQDR